MNWTITGINTVNYIRVDLSGKFCMAGARAASMEVVDEPFWNNGTSILLDYTLVDVDDADVMDVEGMSMMMRSLNEKISTSKIAIVGSSDLQFGFARQFQMKAERHTRAHIRAFRFDPAAIEWLTTDSFHDGQQVSPPSFDAAIFASRAHISGRLGNNLAAG
ncbi:MAG: hypothetical protein ABI999_12680 [Acidobacteriota bacterium]